MAHLINYPESVIESAATWNREDGDACDGCHAEIDVYEDTTYEVTTYVERGHRLKFRGVPFPRTDTLCSNCVSACATCGELIDDATIEQMKLGPQVQYREAVNDGKLSDPMHALCAAENLLGIWAGDRNLTAEETTRERIAEIVGVGFWREWGAA